MTDMSSPASQLSIRVRAPFVLFGGGGLLLDFARRALAAGHAVSAVCGPAHAREAIDGATLRFLLNTLGVSVLETSALSAEALAPHVGGATVGVSVSAPWIVRQDVIDLFGGRLLNVHGSDLPHNRGGGGFTWQILRGDRRGGLSLHLLTAAVDVGGLVLQRTFEYPDTCRTPADFAAYRVAHEHAFIDAFLAQIASGSPFDVCPQDESRAIYWPRVSTAVNGFVDWSWTADEIVRFVAAFGAPHAGAGTYLGEAEVRFSGCHADASDGDFHPFQAGLVFRVHAGEVHVAARGGAVVITQWTDATGGEAPPVRVGARFHTPAAVLDRARRARLVVSADGLTIRE
jgi:methionyl-tRNA formyltransferase